MYFWEAEILGHLAILGQRVDANGEKLWNSGAPVLVTGGSTAHRRTPTAVSDGAGGAFVLFDLEFTSGQFEGHVDVFGQRISADGLPLSASPFIIFGTDFQERNPAAIEDGTGGAIVICELLFDVDGVPPNPDIVGQRFDAGGNRLWSDGAPMAIIATENLDRRPVLVPDGAGGAIVLGEIAVEVAGETVQSDIAAQRINALGSLLWTEGNPVPVQLPPH